MDTDIKISVIIPAYNSAGYILKSLISIYEQTRPVHEVIVVDDGSSDDTVRVVNKYIYDENLINISVISQPNAGPSAARNLGIKHSTGNYIAFLDSDDIWLRDKIKIQERYLREMPELAIICGEMNYTYNRLQETTILDFYKALWKTPFYTSTIIIRKDILLKHRFDEDKRLSEDYKLYMTILKNNLALKIKHQLIYYHIDKSGVSKSLSSQLWKMEKGELDTYLFFCKQGFIGTITFLGVSAFSLLKFVRRALVRFTYN